MEQSESIVEYVASPAGEWLVARQRLFELMDTAGRVVHVSAPAGSGKTFLIRSWIHERGLTGRIGWVSGRTRERDPQAFWLSLLDAVRSTGAGSGRVREVTPAPDLDAAVVIDRLLEDLSTLREPVWLVCDYLHELPPEGVGQLERLPAVLRRLARRLALDPRVRQPTLARDDRLVAPVLPLESAIPQNNGLARSA